MCVHVLLETNMAAFLRSCAFNSRFHNRTTAALTAAQLHVLGLGHKFVPAGYGPTVAGAGPALRQFARRLFIRDFFARAPEWAGSSEPPDPRLRLANQDWHPLRDGVLPGPDGDPIPYVPSPGVQEFLHDVDQQVEVGISRARRMPVLDNLSALERQTVQELRRDPKIVVDTHVHELEDA